MSQVWNALKGLFTRRNRKRKRDNICDISLCGKYFRKKSKGWDCLLLEAVAVFSRTNGKYTLEICVSSEEEQDIELDQCLLLFDIDDNIKFEFDDKGPNNAPSLLWTFDGQELCFESKELNEDILNDLELPTKKRKSGEDTINTSQELEISEENLSSVSEDEKSSSQEEHPLSSSILFKGRVVTYVGKVETDEPFVEVNSSSTCFIRKVNSGYELVLSDEYNVTLLEQNITRGMKPKFTGLERTFQWEVLFDGILYTWKIEFSDPSMYDIFQNALCDVLYEGGSKSWEALSTRDKKKFINSL